MTNNKQDDGSLKSLGITPYNDKRRFLCREIKQHDLVDKTFWVMGVIKDISTKYGSGRYIIKIKFHKDDAESEARKFFTNSSDIKYTIDQIEELNAFPRFVTLRNFNNIFYLE